MTRVLLETRQPVAVRVCMFVWSCRMQQVCLTYHFAVEQRARSFLRTFFGFNGTAGVWRRTAMEQAGGWNMESTVEDMDLSLRAYLNGWKFKYLHWVGCPNELPPTMSAYKTQQYRWNSGPMVVIKQLVSIWAATGQEERRHPEHLCSAALQAAYHACPCVPLAATLAFQAVAEPILLMTNGADCPFSWLSNTDKPATVCTQVTRIWTTDQVTFFDRISCSYFFFRCSNPQHIQLCFPAQHLTSSAMLAADTVA